MTLLYREDNDTPLEDRNDAYLVDMARQAGVSDTAIAEVETTGSYWKLLLTKPRLEFAKTRA